MEHSTDLAAFLAAFFGVTHTTESRMTSQPATATDLALVAQDALLAGRDATEVIAQLLPLAETAGASHGTQDGAEYCAELDGVPSVADAQGADDAIVNALTSRELLRLVGIELGDQAGARLVWDEIRVSFGTGYVRGFRAAIESHLAGAPRTVTVTVEDDGTPSAYYTDEEQARNGATDYSVTIVDGEQTIEGEITLYRDHDGRMAPCGSPADGWISAPVLTWMRGLDQRSYGLVAGTLGGGVGSEELEVASARR